MNIWGHFYVKRARLFNRLNYWSLRFAAYCDRRYWADHERAWWYYDKPLPVRARAAR